MLLSMSLLWGLLPTESTTRNTQQVPERVEASGVGRYQVVLPCRFCSVSGGEAGRSGLSGRVLPASGGRRVNPVASRCVVFLLDQADVWGPAPK